MIPLSIISENAEGRQYVFTVVDKDDKKGKAKRAFVVTGRTQDDKIEILSGVNPGDEIVEEGARSVKDDQEVKILNGYNQDVK